MVSELTETFKSSHLKFSVIFTPSVVFLFCSLMLLMQNSYNGNLKNLILQGGWGGLPTGNGKKLSSSQAQQGQATCLAVAYFLSISCGPSTLYSTQLRSED